MSSATCRTCGKPLTRRRGQFCNRNCYAEAYRRGLIENKGHFKRGAPSMNKGRTLESWVGKERAAEIRAMMSVSSKKKGNFLRELNWSGDILRKRIVSRWFHEEVVEALVNKLREEGWRCYILSEYVKEKRTPDAILFDGKEMVALEVELQKRWKPSQESMTNRLSDLNESGFFDKTTVVFPREGDEMSELIPRLLAMVRGTKD